jgi:hypothetical protein
MLIRIYLDNNDGAVLRSSRRCCLLERNFGNPSARTSSDRTADAMRAARAPSPR